MTLGARGRRYLGKTVRACTIWLARRRHVRRMLPVPTLDGRVARNVLVVGIYLADRPHEATHLVSRFAASRLYSVTQAWVALGGGADSDRLDAVTVQRITERIPKFVLLNRMLRQFDLSQFDYLVVSDDDVTLPKGFLDAYLSYQEMHDFALAQPARTTWSHADHLFVVRRPFLIARETRFVEIGPIFSIRRDTVPLLVPFDESSPMGWGYDQAWPHQLGESGRRLGIIDATPVDHSWREQGATYSYGEEMKTMRDFLGRNRHLQRREAQVVLNSHPGTWRDWTPGRRWFRHV